MRPDPLNRRPAPAASRLLVALIGLLVCEPLAAQVFLPARRVVPFLTSAAIDPIIYWALEEASGTRFSCGLNEWDLSDSTSIGQVAGKVDFAAGSFNGTSQFLNGPTNSISSSFTLTAWAYLTDTNNGHTIISKDVASTNRSFWLGYNTNRSRFRFQVSKNGSTVEWVDEDLTGTPALNTWYLLNASYNATNGQLAIYVNNNAGSTAQSGTLFAGYEMEEASGVREDCYTGNRDLADPTSAGSAAGIIGNGVNLTGAKYLTGSTNSFTNDIGLSVWVKLNSLSSSQTILSKDDFGASRRTFWLGYITNTSRFRWQISTNGTAVIFQDENTLGAPATNVWYHIVANFFRNADRMEIYVNNNAGSVKPNLLANQGLFSSVQQFAVGALFNSGTPTSLINGVVDEVGIFTRVLTASDRATLYNSGAGIHPCAIPLAAGDIWPSEVNVQLGKFTSGGSGSEFWIGNLDEVGILTHVISSADRDYIWNGGAGLHLCLP